MSFPILLIVVHCSATQNGKSLRTKTWICIATGADLAIG